MFYVQFEYEENVDEFEGVARKRPLPLYHVLLKRIIEFFRKSSNPTLLATHLWFFLDVCVKVIYICLYGVFFQV